MNEEPQPETEAEHEASTPPEPPEKDTPAEGEPSHEGPEGDGGEDASDAEA
jgi:hypothetical protein